MSFRLFVLALLLSVDPVSQAQAAELTEPFAVADPADSRRSMAALKYLYEERKVTATGHETTDTDPGLVTSKADYTLETYVLSDDHYQIELLTNLDQLPEAGAIVIVTFPKPKGGSGFPARVFAIVPN